MALNPVIALLGRRLRLAGSVAAAKLLHRGHAPPAARTDDRYEIVAAALSSDPARSGRRSPASLPAERSYASGSALIRAESAHASGADVIAIMTLTTAISRCPVEALDHSLHVICDKPLTNSAAEAAQIVERARARSASSASRTTTSYPMVRQARAMVAEGLTGRSAWCRWSTCRGGRARPGPGAAWEGRPGARWPVAGDGRHRHACAQPAALHHRSGGWRRWRPRSAPSCLSASRTTSRAPCCACPNGARQLLGHAGRGRREKRCASA